MVTALRHLRGTLARGGVVIDTGDGVALRTVIQPAGDMLCFIDEKQTTGDDILWRQHAEAVHAHLRGAGSALEVVQNAYRLLTFTLTGILVAVLTAFLGWLPAALTGVVVVVAGAGVRKLELIARRAVRGVVQVALRSAAVLLLAATAAGIWAIGRGWDALSFLGVTGIWLILNWAAHRAVRRFLGLGRKAGWVT